MNSKYINIYPKNVLILKIKSICVTSPEKTILLKKSSIINERKQASCIFLYETQIKEKETCFFYL